MRIEFENPDVQHLAALYASQGIEARPVGGAVRDRLLGGTPKDDDFAVDALPEDVMAVAEANGLKVIPTGLKHGTVTIVLNDVGYEMTTLRTDLETNGRHATVGFVKDFKLDAERRDFTINAMSADHLGQVYDYFDGLRDLENGTIRFVGNAEQRVQEDYLRILRFFRFSARFGQANDPEAIAAIKAHASGLEMISVERVWKEVKQIVGHERGLSQLTEMKRLGVAEAIGMGFFPDETARFSKLHALTRDPVLLIGSLFNDPSEAEVFGTQWRLSSGERLLASMAARVIGDVEDTPHYWRCLQVDGVISSEVAPVLAATGRHAAANAVLKDVPEFPVLGRDLQSVGLTAGRQMGLTLARLKDAWKESGFSHTKQDLLDLATTPAAQSEAPAWPLR